MYICGRLGSAVSKSTRLRAGRSGFRIETYARHFFSSPKGLDQLWGPIQPPTHCKPGSFPG